jgi:hypothetical protein
MECWRQILSHRSSFVSLKHSYHRTLSKKHREKFDKLMLSKTTKQWVEGFEMSFTNEVKIAFSHLLDTRRKRYVVGFRGGGGHFGKGLTPPLCSPASCIQRWSRGQFLLIKAVCNDQVFSVLIRRVCTD